jgi:hypothetical protein
MTSQTVENKMWSQNNSLYYRCTMNNTLLTYEPHTCCTVTQLGTVLTFSPDKLRANFVLRANNTTTLRPVCIDWAVMFNEEIDFLLDVRCSRRCLRLRYPGLQRRVVRGQPNVSEGTYCLHLQGRRVRQQAERYMALQARGPYSIDFL